MTHQTAQMRRNATFVLQRFGDSATTSAHAVGTRVAIPSAVMRELNTLGLWNPLVRRAHLLAVTAIVGLVASLFVTPAAAHPLLAGRQLPTSQLMLQLRGVPPQPLALEQTMSREDTTLSLGLAPPAEWQAASLSVGAMLWGKLGFDGSPRPGIPLSNALRTTPIGTRVTQFTVGGTIAGAAAGLAAGTVTMATSQSPADLFSGAALGGLTGALMGFAVHVFRPAWLPDPAPFDLVFTVAAVNLERQANPISRPVFHWGWVPAIGGTF